MYEMKEMERGFYGLVIAKTGYMVGCVLSAGYLKRNNFLCEENRENMPRGNKRYIPVTARLLWELKNGERVLYIQKGNPYVREYMTFDSACSRLRYDVQRERDTAYYVKGD